MNLIKFPSRQTLARNFFEIRIDATVLPDLVVCPAIGSQFKPRFWVRDEVL